MLFHSISLISNRSLSQGRELLAIPSVVSNQMETKNQPAADKAYINI